MLLAFSSRFVRQALLYALCMCLLSCPTHFLLTDLHSEVMECHGWVTGMFLCSNWIRAGKAVILNGKDLRVLVVHFLNNARQVIEY